MACALGVKGVKLGEGHSSTSPDPPDPKGSGPRDAEKIRRHDNVQVGRLQGKPEGGPPEVRR